MISEERIEELCWTELDRRLLSFARAIEAEVRAEAQEPVAWFVFADNNGPVPLELWGFDQKACKHAVLENARSVGWKGTIEGYLLNMGWAIRPLYTASQPPAPCPDSVSMANWLELTGKYSEATQLIVDLQAKVEEQAEIAAKDALLEQAKEALAAMVMEARARDCGLRIADEALATIERHQKGEK